MPTEVTLHQVLDSLRGWSGLANYNLAVLLVPAGLAWNVRQRLLDCWPNTVDFDAEVIRHLLAGDWAASVAEAREGRHGSLTAALDAAVEEVAACAGDEPLVVTNVNLPALAGWDRLGQRLYLASRRGLVLLAVVGTVEAHRIALHGRLSFLAEDNATVVALREEA